MPSSASFPIQAQGLPQSQPPELTLPSPDELMPRVSEAKSSAELLIQLIQSTPLEDIQGSELIKEFSDRCRAASRAVHTYIGSTDPAPDEQTLATLIETSEGLSKALSKYSHALLDSRKEHGESTGDKAKGPTASQASPPSARLASLSVSSDSSASSASGAVVNAPRPSSSSSSRGNSRRPVSSLYSDSLDRASSSSSAGPSAIPRSNRNSSYTYRSVDSQSRNPFADPRSTGKARMNVRRAR